jgi:hypothetical protein
MSGLFTNKYEVTTKSGSVYILEFSHGPLSKPVWRLKAKKEGDSPEFFVFGLLTKDNKFIRASAITKIEQFMDCVIGFDKKEVPENYFETYEENPRAVLSVGHTSRVLAWR